MFLPDFIRHSGDIDCYDSLFRDFPAPIPYSWQNTTGEAGLGFVIYDCQAEPDPAPRDRFMI